MVIIIYYSKINMEQLSKNNRRLLLPLILLMHLRLCDIVYVLVEIIGPNQYWYH